MCDWVDGQLIISFPENDSVALALMEGLHVGRINGLTHLQDLAERIEEVSQHSVHMRPNLGYQVHLVAVPPQEEAWYSTRVHTEYQQLLLDRILGHDGRRPGPPPPSAEFNVQPNHVLSTTFRFPSWRSGTPVKSADFTFSNYHDQYKRMLGLPPNLSPSQAGQIRILILDTGLADDLDTFNFPLAERRNFVDHNNPTLGDDNGHGTVVAQIIHSLIGEAQILAYKVADSEGRASEWDTLAALAAGSGAHLINMSLAFGLRPRRRSLLCSQCERESQQSRSQVFETIIRRVADSNPHPVLIAAAGNYNKNELAFPARYSQVIAISSITSTGDLSPYSNYGDLDQSKDVHLRRFVMPGGEDTEGIGTFSTQANQEYYGTSFAAAYASGFVATFLARTGVQFLNNTTFWDSLREQATTSSLKGSDYAKFGNGLLKF